MSKLSAGFALRIVATEQKLGGRALGFWRGLALVLPLAFLFCSLAHAQISPGPLARAHQSLAGDTNCTKCHEVSTSAPTFKCADCHREIAGELQRNHGLHATYPRSGPKGAACVKCHSDHNGVEFNMIRWTPTLQGFDHSKTGYVLDGKHAAVQCKSCHAAQHISAAARPLLVSKDLNRTYFGLSTSCSTCHTDIHQGRFGTECRTCHTTSDWKAAQLQQDHFDHSKTRFPLLGAHKEVACQKCHTPGDDGKPRYQGIAFAACANCHADPHKGEFKQGCDFCHTTVTFKRSRFTTKFDHSTTDFPLVGKHLEVDCVTCHKGPDFHVPIAHKTCEDCHNPDPHGGQFAKRLDGGKCVSCHNEQGWSPSLFTVADHAKSGYPIKFPHEKVTCAGCHIPAGKETRFKIKFAECTDCHKDEHEGQFAAKPWLNRCEQCHNGATFKTSSFTLAKHQQSSFPLTGGHMAVACNECHKPAEASQVALFHFSQLSCTSCHEDIHKGQFVERMAKAGPGGKAEGCESCHSTKAWDDLARFDHAQTKFPLLGAHRAVTCAECHKPPNMELKLVHVTFKSAPSACSECHENPHSDQFGARANDCASCHNSTKWKPSLFDHDKTIFPLKGGHENVACAKCHTVKKPVNDVMVLFYKPTPSACSACHGSEIPKATSFME